MSQPNSINRLPSEVCEALHGWLRDPAITQTEATQRTNALLDELGLAERVSLSAVNRYDKRTRAACEQVLQSRQAFESWADRLGSEPVGQFGRLAAEMMRTAVFNLASRLQDLEIDDKALPGIVQSVLRIALTAESLERSSEIAVRCEREIKRQAAEEAAKARKANPPPLDAKRMQEVVRQIYGVELPIQEPEYHTPSPVERAS